MTIPEGLVKYASIAFAVIYLGIGITVIVKSSELHFVRDGYTVPFGIVLIIYGLFRGYRAFQRYY